MLIELDDSSHQESKRQERDKFVNEVFRQAGLPLLRVKARSSYSTGELSLAIKEKMANGDGMTEELVTESAA